MDTAIATPVRLGISACLLGQKVRYDGGHKRNAFLVEAFGRYVEWVPVCPEVEMGLGVPRETLRLELQGDDIRLIMSKTGVDYTERLRGFAAARLEALAKEGLCGYIFKKDSPSCGLEHVRLHPPNGLPRKTGRGLFAAALIQ